MRIDLGISVMGAPNSKETHYVHITRGDVIKRIKTHPAIDPWTRDYLVKKVNEYPDNALVYFVQNINQLVITALNERTRLLKEREKENDNFRSEEKSGEGTDSVLVGEDGSTESGTGVGEVEIEETEDRESLFSRTPGRDQG